MRITSIRDIVVPIRSEIWNAYISFAEMTVPAVAIHTDAVRRGNAIVGYGFHSNGRYARRGILPDRLIPRLMSAQSGVLLDDSAENFDPTRVWQVMMANEKPGGHGERCVAVGTLDMAFWDVIAKIEGKPLYRLLADRYQRSEADEEVYVYGAGITIRERS